MGQFFKKSRKDKKIEFENRIEDIAELEDMGIFRMYKNLKSKSEKLDGFIKDKLLQIKESLLQPPIKLQQNLRLKISSKFDKENLEWTLRIAGRVMTQDKAEILDPDSDLKMLQFFDKIFIEFEKNDKITYMNIDWRKLNHTDNLHYDAIDITRKAIPEVDSFNVTIKFFKDYAPKEYLLSDELAQILKIRQGSMLKINNALWMYIKLNRLQDRDKIIFSGGKYYAL